jgi:6-pyruvoyltetrahydropterin/6-carboxytetrahydropterin synthase
MQLNLRRTFEASHVIPNHKGKCKNLHGHSYQVEVRLSGIHHSKDGIFIDFGDIKQIIDKFDHSYLNDCFKFPSAENLARYFALKILRLNRNTTDVTVTVYETENACAVETVLNPLMVQE